MLYREFEEALSNVEPIQHNQQAQLGNSGYLNQDCTPDALNLYESLVTSYKWADNVCNFILNQTSFRLYVQLSFSMHHFLTAF